MSDTDQPQATQPAATDNNPETTVTADPEEQKVLRRSRRWLKLSAIIALGLCLGAGLVAWQQEMGLDRDAAPPMPSATLPTSNPPSGDEAVVLRQQMTALQDRLAALETRQATTHSGADLAALSNRINGLETSLHGLEAQPKLPATLSADLEELRKGLGELKRSSADAATVLRLLDRVEQVESQMRTLQSRHAGAVALLLACGQLREAVHRAMPFDDEWRALVALGNTDKTIEAALAPLKSHAISGIPTVNTLVIRFTALSPALLRAELLPPDQQSWWRRSLDRLASLVTVRREDAQAAGDSTAAILARAEAALSAGDLTTASREVASLPADPAKAAAAWLADAKARIEADAALSSLTAHLIAAVGAGQ